MGASKLGWVRRAAVGAAILGSAAAGIAAAQAQPATSETAAVTSCLCLHRALETSSADMKARVAALGALRQRLAGLDAELAREKPKVDVNNPDSVARFKALLERRDAAYHESLGPANGAADAAVARYNERVGEYNRDCAGRPFDAVLTHRVEAALVCPPVR
jgi:hypothetical protein